MDKSADRGAFCVQQETTDTEEMKPSPTRKMEHPHTAWVLLQTSLLTLQENGSCYWTVQCPIYLPKSPFLFSLIIVTAH